MLIVCSGAVNNCKTKAIPCRDLDQYWKQSQSPVIISTSKAS